MNKRLVNTSLPAAELKEKAEAVLRKSGISLAYAYEWLYRQIIVHEGLPSDIAMSNETTIQAMEEARQGKGKTYNSVNELFADSEI